MYALGRPTVFERPVSVWRKGREWYCYRPTPGDCINSPHGSREKLVMPDEPVEGSSAHVSLAARRLCGYNLDMAKLMFLPLHLLAPPALSWTMA